MPCVSGVLSQHVAACRVETTLQGWWAPPIELVGGGSVRGWVDGHCEDIGRIVKNVEAKAEHETKECCRPNTTGYL